MSDWRSYVQRMEELAARLGLTFHPVEFEAVPDAFMMEIAVYGLPVRMPHWSFGVRYIYQLIQRNMGHSRLFEVVFPGNPGHAYLSNGNGLAENVLVTAHVLGHADFSRNNMLFRRCQEQVSEHIVEHAASHARQISQAIENHGPQRVEAALDAALALEQHIDIDQRLRRERYPEFLPDAKALVDDDFRRRFASLDPVAAKGVFETRKRAPVPPHPERDLLWFIAHYAPEMESWERDIFLAVREESFYFYPVFATQIMNEGWASYWHARLLREADFVPAADLCGCHQVPLRCGAPDGRGPADRTRREPLSPGVFTVGEDHRERGPWTPRARSCSRMMTSASCAIISRARSPRSWSCSASLPAATARSRSWTGTCTALHEALARARSTTSAHRIFRYHSCATMGRWNCSTTT